MTEKTNDQTIVEKSVTPYGLAMILNDYLKMANEKEVRPQMMYNYAKNNLIKGATKTNEGWLIPAKQANEFAIKFLTKRNAL